MEIDEQYELYEKLMLKSIEEPTEILNTCIRVIVTMNKLNKNSNEEFKELLDFMEKLYAQLGSYDEILLKSLILKEVMGL